MRFVVRMILALGSIALIRGLDAALSPRVLFSPLYALPVAIRAWYLGRRIGIVSATA